MSQDPKPWPIGFPYRRRTKEPEVEQGIILDYRWKKNTRRRGPEILCKVLLDDDRVVERQILHDHVSPWTPRTTVLPERSTTSFPDQHIWVRDDQDSVMIFRRPPTRIIPYRAHNARVLELQNNNWGYMKDTDEPKIQAFDVTVPLSVFHENVQKQAERRSLPGRQLVNLSVEIMKEFQEHRYPFFELPRVGPLPDWKEINSIAIALDWTCIESGRHYSVYLHNEKRSVAWPGSTTREYPFPGRIVEYAQGRGLLNYFLRRRPIDKSILPWEFYFGLPILKTSHARMSRDTFEFAPYLPSVIQRAPRRSAILHADAVRKQLGRLGFKHIGKWLGHSDEEQKSESKKLGSDDRRECDFCTLLATEAGFDASKTCHRKTNEDGSFDNVCFLCYKYGRPCSWTPLDILTSSSTIHDAIMYLENVGINHPLEHEVQPEEELPN